MRTMTIQVQEQMAPRLTGEFKQMLQDIEIQFRFSVKQDYAVSLEFTMRGKPYSFNLIRWKQKGQSKFLPLFHEHSGRVLEEFGQIIYTDDMMPVFQMTEDQHVAAVLQATKDVLTTLDKIVQHYERSVLDYCVWYRENHQETGTYSELITLMCCHCVVHSNFLAPNISYEIIKF